MGRVDKLKHSVSIDEEITKRMLDIIEQALDKLFSKLGIDIEFTKHFLDRLNDARNGIPISTEELIRIYKHTFDKHGPILKKMKDDAEAVIKEFSSNINIPFVLNITKNGKIELVAKTIMRKKNFKTPTKVLGV